MEEMNYEIHTLSRDNDGYREMDNKIALDDHEPTAEEIDSLWEKNAEGEIEAESDEEALNALWPLYNRGSGRALIEEMNEAEMPSLSTNDIVVVGSTAYLCASVGWKEIGVMSSRCHATQ